MSDLTYDAAVAMLPEGDEIHTFRGGGGFFVGADWPRESVLEAMREAEVLRRSEGLAAGMNHGLAVARADGWLYVATTGASA